MMDIMQRSEAWEWWIHKIVELYDHNMLTELMSTKFYDVLYFELYHENFYHFHIQCKKCEMAYNVPIYKAKLMNAYLRLFEAFVNSHFVDKENPQFKCLELR